MFWEEEHQPFLLLAVLGTCLLVGVGDYGALIYIGLKV